MKSISLLFEENPDSDLNDFRRKLCGLDTEASIENELISVFGRDLEQSIPHPEVAEKICKLVAELAKDETCRDRFVDKGFFPVINKHLEKSLQSPLEDSNQLVLKIQICRAIGNLCFYNGMFWAKQALKNPV